MMRVNPVLIGLVMSGLSSLGHATTQLRIEADGGIEVFDAEGRAEAHRNVITTYGDMILRCPQLNAYYQRGEEGARGKLRSLQARGTAAEEVRFEGPGERARGMDATYNVLTEELVLFGAPPEVELLNKSGEVETHLTADHKITYDRQQGRVVAKNVRMIRADQQVDAGHLEVFLTEKKGAAYEPVPQGSEEASSDQFSIEKAIASEGVTLVTPHEVVTADKGFFDGRTDKAYLVGHVQIAHKEARKGSKKTEIVQMRGRYAEVDRKTGRSRLLAQLPTQANLPAEFGTIREELGRPEATTPPINSTGRVQVLIIQEDVS